MRNQAMRRALLALLAGGGATAAMANQDEAEAIPLRPSALGARGAEGARLIRSLERQRAEPRHIWSETLRQIGMPGERYRGSLVFEAPDDSFAMDDRFGEGLLRDFVQHDYLPEHVLNMTARFRPGLVADGVVGTFDPIPGRSAPRIEIGRQYGDDIHDVRSAAMHEITHASNDQLTQRLAELLRNAYKDQRTRDHALLAAEARALQSELSLRMSDEGRAALPFSFREYDPRIAPEILRTQERLFGRLPGKKRLKNDSTEAIDKELRRWPGVQIEYSYRKGGHIEAKLTYNGKSRFYVLPSTGSDWRGPKNAVAAVRRILAEQLGAKSIHG